MRRLKRYMVAITFCFMVTTGIQPAHAQFDTDELLDQMNTFNNTVITACDLADQAGNVVDLGDTVNQSIVWFCALRPSLERAYSMAQSFNTDVTGFFTDAVGDGLTMLVGSSGWDTGDVDLGALLTEGMDDVANGTFSAVEWTRRTLSLANQALIEDVTAPPKVTDAPLVQDAVNAARQDPLRVERELKEIERRGESLMQAAKAKDTVMMSQQLAASSMARGDEQKLLDKVTNPNPVGTPGTADTATKLGKDANSSRAAIQAMVQAQADFMRQSAVSTANLTTAMKESAAQQVFTTQQLGTLAESISRQQVDAYEQWRSEYYTELGTNMAEVDTLRRNLLITAEIFGKVEPGGAP